MWTVKRRSELHEVATERNEDAVHRDMAAFGGVGPGFVCAALSRPEGLLHITAMTQVKAWLR
jgi:hypothetical protein